MYFPKKVRPLALAFVVSGLLASASVLAAKPASTGGANLPEGKLSLPSYMITAANLDNADYLKCIAAHVNMKNIIATYDAALDCKKN